MIIILLLLTHVVKAQEDGSEIDCTIYYQNAKEVIENQSRMDR